MSCPASLANVSAVAGLRAGGGVGDAARGDDHPCRPLPCVRSRGGSCNVRRRSCRRASSALSARACRKPESPRPVSSPAPAFPACWPASHALPLWGNTQVAAFEVEFQAPPFEEADGGAVVEFGECQSAKKSALVRTCSANSSGGRALVRLQRPLARDADLAARLRHLFDYEHLLAVLCGRSCGHHACGAGAYDDYVVHFSVVFCLPKIRLSEGNCKHCLLLPLLNSYL